MSIGRLGAELKTPLGQHATLWASGAWGHRFDDASAGASGEVLAISSPFAVPGYLLDQDWAEGSIGLSVRAAPGALLHARIGASTDGATQPDLNFGIGAPRSRSELIASS